MEPSARKADFAAFMIGLSSLWIQVVLIRRLMAAFSGNELTIGMVLAAWMVWTGIGSMAPARYSDRVRNPANTLALLFAAVAAALVPAVLATARIKPWLGVGMGEIAGLPAMLLASFIITFIPCSLLGFAFNLAARMQRDHRAAAGRAYRFEALGALVSGGLLAVWFGSSAQPVSPAVALGIVMIPAAMAVADRPSGGGRWMASVPILLAALLVFILAGGGRRPGSADEIYHRLYWNGREPLSAFDSRYGYLAAVKRGGEVTIFEDGSPVATLPDPAGAERLAHLPLLMCASPSRVLLIGGGFTGMARQILKHPIEHLDYLQLDPGMVEIEQSRATEAEDLWSDPRIKVVVGDGRAWLRRGPRPYDAVIVNLPDPLTAGLNRFYTAEFFREVKEALEPGGVLAFTAGVTPPNMSYTPAQLGLMAGAARTLDQVFPRRLVLPLDDNLFLAGDSTTDLTADPGVIQARLDRMGIQSFYAGSSMVSPQLDPGLLRELNARIQSWPAEIDRDLHPRGFLYAVMLWSEKASPHARDLITRVSRLDWKWMAAFPALVLLLGGVWVGAGGGRARAALAAGVSGFSAIVIEVAVMVAFQVVEGSVYFAMSLLAAAFMAGLCAGAWLWERRGTGLGRAEVLLAGWSLVALAAVWGLAEGRVTGAGVLAGFCLVLLGQGVVAGMVFPAAVAAVKGDESSVGRSVGWVNGAEHLGSALGGLLAGSVLVAVFGVMGSIACVAATAISLVAISAAFRRPGG